MAREVPERRVLAVQPRNPPGHIHLCSKKSEHATHFNKGIFANQCIEKYQKNAKNAWAEASGRPTTDLQPVFQGIFGVFQTNFSIEKQVLFNFKKRRQLTFFTMIFSET